MKRIFIVITLTGALLTGCTQKSANERLFEQQFIKSLMVKVTEWQLNNPKHELCDWTNGAFYAGVFAAWETTRSDVIYKALLDMGEKNGWKPCNTWAMDRANDFGICQTYVDLFRIEKQQKMIRPFVDTVNVFMSRHYHGQVDNAEDWWNHVKDYMTPERTKKYKVIKWWWCDALFMEPPALVKLGVTLNNPAYLAYSDANFKDCYNLLYDQEEHLFARDLMYIITGEETDKREKNGKKIFWSRGNGWVLAGLARILNELPADYVERPFYEKLFKEMSAKIISIQPEDGLWRSSLLDPDSYPAGELSGSGFYCYGLAWGVNHGLLDKKTYLPAVEKAWIGLNSCVSEEGLPGWVQPIGDNPLRNFNKDSWAVYGTGAFLLAGSEVIKLKR